MRKLGLSASALLLMLQLISASSAKADAKVADCFQFKNPTSYLSSTSLSISADVYAICDSATLGRGNGQKPVYSLVEQTDITLSGCPGPVISPLSGNGLLGKVTCTVRVGDSPLSSSRIGASYTTIKAWFSWDFSTRTVGVSHSPIPGPSKATTNSSAGQAPSAPTPIRQTPSPTPTQNIESPETTQALKELDSALEEVNKNVKIADDAINSASIAASTIAPLIQLVENLIEEVRERISSWIEMLQNKKSS